MEDPAAIRDALTGAYSRAMLDERLPDEVERSRRYGTSLCLLVFDVDYFKSVNDAFGHARGDAVLQEITARVLAAIRGSDILFRYGGDEFVLLLPNTQRDPGTMVASRIESAIAGRPIPGEPPLSVTVSIGLSVFPEDAQSARALFDAADHRNYQAKRKGRACVVADGPVAPSDHPIQESTKLIDRDEPLDQLQLFLDRLPNLRRGIFNIVGNTGLGRTRFLTEAIAAARLRNYGVVQIPGVRREKLRPFGAYLAASPPYLPSPEAGMTAVASALEAERTARQQRGVLIAVDDEPDLDPVTRQLLEGLLACETVQCLGLLIVSEPRPGTPNREPPPIPSETATLTPLSLAGAREWLRQALQWDAPSQFVEWLHEGTKGIPSALYQAVLRLREQGTLRRVATREWIVDPAYPSAPLQKRIHGFGLSSHRPAAMTEFVGRENDQKNVNVLIDRCRLVTLAGPRGIGKTRLAHQVARSRASDFADGVRIVSLARAADASSVLVTLAVALGVREQPGRGLHDAVLAHLSEKELLLVLDGFDHVLATAPLVAEIMVGAPLVRLVITTREPLRISGEHVFPVPPLTAPNPDNLPPGDDPMRYSAVALFVHRAQAAFGGFTLATRSIRTVVDLCTRLLGVPLAIELVASHADHATLEELLSRGIQSRRPTSPKSDPPRQQREDLLHSVVTWSAGLLDDEARRVLARMSVFAGSTPIEAISTVCCDEDRSLGVSRSLSMLVERGFVQPDLERTTEQRLQLVDSVRAYAAEQLRGLGEEERRRVLHAEHFATYADHLIGGLRGPRQRATLDLIAVDYPNFRAALHFARAARPHLAVTLALALAPFWERRGHFHEAIDFCGTLALHPELTFGERARCLARVGRINRFLRNGDEAETRLRDAEHLARQDKDDPMVAFCLRERGCVARDLNGNTKQAEALFYESLTVARSIGEDRGVARALSDLALVALSRGDLEPCAATCEESLTIARRIGDEQRTGVVFSVLAQLERTRGNAPRAYALYEDRLRVAEWLDDRHALLDTLAELSDLAASVGDDARASSALLRRAALLREDGDIEGAATAWNALAELSMKLSRWDDAHSSYERAEHLLETSGKVPLGAALIHTRGTLALSAGDLETAEQAFVETIERARETNDMALVTAGAAGLAATYASTQRHLNAARLLGFVDAHLPNLLPKLVPPLYALVVRHVSMAKAKLLPDDLTSGQAEGRRLSIEEALALH